MIAIFAFGKIIAPYLADPASTGPARVWRMISGTGVVFRRALASSVAKSHHKSNGPWFVWRELRNFRLTSARSERITRQASPDGLSRAPAPSEVLLIM